MTVPPSASMTWTLLAPVMPATIDPAIELRIDFTGNVNPTHASDINTLVIFRNGLEVTGDTP